MSQNIQKTVTGLVDRHALKILCVARRHRSHAPSNSKERSPYLLKRMFSSFRIGFPHHFQHSSPCFYCSWALLLHNIVRFPPYNEITDKGKGDLREKWAAPLWLKWTFSSTFCSSRKPLKLSWLCAGNKEHIPYESAMLLLRKTPKHCLFLCWTTALLYYAIIFIWQFSSLFWSISRLDIALSIRKKQTHVFT